MSMPYDSEAKKEWNRNNLVHLGVKLFRPIKGKQNDGDIIDYLEGKVKGEVVKAALREYMANHPDAKPFWEEDDDTTLCPYMERRKEERTEKE